MKDWVGQVENQHCPQLREDTCDSISSFPEPVVGLDEINLGIKETTTSFSCSQNKKAYPEISTVHKRKKSLRNDLLCPIKIGTRCVTDSNKTKKKMGKRSVNRCMGVETVGEASRKAKIKE